MATAAVASPSSTTNSPAGAPEARTYETTLGDLAGTVAREGVANPAIILIRRPKAIAAALLHDTVEDAGVTFDEIERRFGPQVAAIVRELTDDMSLPKAARKRHQLLGAPSRSHRAALIKVADKTSNVRSITLCPPDWCASRKAAYVDWARQVVHALPSVERDARDEFEVALDLYRTHAEPGEARGGLYAL